MPEISIIVPIYNVEPYLPRCLDSILAQTFTDFELILVDDGSPDQCGEICDNAKEQDKRIRVIHKKNGGLSDARNVGIDVAKGDYLLFIDSDDFVAPNMVEKLYKALNENDADYAMCGTVKVLDGKELAVVSKTQLQNRTLTNLEALALIKEPNTMFVAAWNKLYKKELFSSIRFPVGKLYEDEATIYKITYLCKRVTIISDELYFYVLREGSITRSFYTIRNLDKFDVLYERVLFYEANGLAYLASFDAELMIRNYLDMRFNIQDDAQTLKKRFIEIRHMTRYVYYKYSEHITATGIIAIEFPSLYKLLAKTRIRYRIRHAFKWIILDRCR